MIIRDFSTLRRAVLGLVIPAVLTLTIAGCSKAGKIANHLAAGDKYYAAGEYDKAEIEYKNVLQSGGPLNGHAIGQLGIIYIEQGLVRQSAPYLMKSKELEPDNLPVRIKLAMLYLSARKFKEAREEAEYVLTRRPSDGYAPILLVEASATSPADVQAARQRLSQLPAEIAKGAPVLTALGIADLRERNLGAAENAFRNALSADPKFVAAFSSLAMVHLAKNDRASAGEELKQAADLSPVRSGKALTYAQFKIQTGDKEAGRKILEDLCNQAPDYLPPHLGLAEMAATDKRYDDSAGLVAKVLARDPTSAEALLLDGRLKLAKGEPAKAVTVLEKMVQTYPNSSNALYFLGLAHAAQGETEKAVDRLTQANKISPTVEATLALASINLRSGAYNVAIQGLEPVVKASPTNIQARMMLAEAYRAEGNFDRSLNLYQQAEKDFPGNPQILFQTGLTLLQQNRTADARRCFTEALAKAPNFVPALEQVVNMDVAAGRYASAIELINTHLAQNASSAAGHLILGRVYEKSGDSAKAEAAFLKSIELRPDVPPAYFQLAQLYVATKQQAKALASLKEVTDRDPKDVKAWLMTGLIQDQEKNPEGARLAYEKILALESRHGLALNNLAVLYSEKLNDLDKAADLAQRAREVLFEEPNVADTLGWILHKKGQYGRALPLLEESATALPNDASVQYHLGTTRYMMGLEPTSREAFERALKLDPALPAAPEIRRRLELLSMDPQSLQASDIKGLEKTLAEWPGDPVILSRIAAAYERAGSFDKAIAAYEASAKANPGSPHPLMGLARLYGRNDPKKGLDAAKAARKLAPDDLAITRAVGTLAYQAGDFTWAASLFEEAVRRQPDDAELLFEASQVVYSIGRVDAARELATQAQTVKPVESSTGKVVPFSHSGDTKQFLELTELATKPDPAASEKINQVLASHPSDVPALMALGALQEKKSDTAAAWKTYEHVLARFPEFAPVKLRLALIAASQPQDEPKAFSWAQQARNAFSNDPDAAKALGILTQRKGGDSRRAITLLQEAVAAAPDDAESTYYLGLAQLDEKQVAQGKAMLEKAIGLGLRSELSKEAQKKLAAKE